MDYFGGDINTNNLELFFQPELQFKKLISKNNLDKNDFDKFKQFLVDKDTQPFQKVLGISRMREIIGQIFYQAI